MKRIGIIGFTRKGCLLAKRLASGLTGIAAHVECPVFGPARLADELGIEPYGDLKTWTARRFAADDALVFVGASGIAVRAIAPYVRDKFSDPAVVSVDEAGLFVVPLLSGHVGGANELARAVAETVGAQVAVSTATDVNGLFAVDEWAAQNGFFILEREIAKEISAALLEGRAVGYESDCILEEEPRGVVKGAENGVARIGFVVSADDAKRPFETTLHLVPRIAAVGVGCRKGTDPLALERAVLDALVEAHVSQHAVAALASIDVKADEAAIRALASKMGWGLRFYSAEELASVPGDFSSSEFVKRSVGVDNVCERAACAEGGTLVLGKQASDGVTVAIALRETALPETILPVGNRFPTGRMVGETVSDRIPAGKTVGEPVPEGQLPSNRIPAGKPVSRGESDCGETDWEDSSASDRIPAGKPVSHGENDREDNRGDQSPTGKLSVIGLGPGGAADMTGRARAAIQASDLIAGYTVYVDLLRDEFPGKEAITTPMRKEVERCRLALEHALAGRHVAMVCSGDPGVYGMAGLIFELAREYPPIPIEVIPGVSASNGGAAVLGAPLMHDYCVISLSDLLTPWEKIEQRLIAAAEADLVISIYNPSSHKRPDYLRRACDILLAHKDAATICGTVRNIGRDGQEAHVMTLAELRDTQVDMFTTAFIGNSQTMEIDGRMVTPRGYLQREE